MTVYSHSPEGRIPFAIGEDADVRPPFSSADQMPGASDDTERSYRPAGRVVTAVAAAALAIAIPAYRFGMHELHEHVHAPSGNGAHVDAPLQQGDDQYRH